MLWFFGFTLYFCMDYFAYLDSLLWDDFLHGCFARKITELCRPDFLYNVLP